MANNTMAKLALAIKARGSTASPTTLIIVCKLVIFDPSRFSINIAPLFGRTVPDD